jgi:hypothetical protein
MQGPLKRMDDRKPELREATQQSQKVYQSMRIGSLESGDVLKMAEDA